MAKSEAIMRRFTEPVEMTPIDHVKEREINVMKNKMRQSDDYKAGVEAARLNQHRNFQNSLAWLEGYDDQKLGKVK
jgi:hypothetical protein